LDETGIYKMKLFPLMPLIFIAAYTFVGVSIAIQTPETAAIGVAVLLGFVILYFITRNKNNVITGEVVPGNKA
jgi:APA family basic amino acid/polyamine antiporter